MAQASLPLQSNRNPSARTNVSLGRLDTQHLGSVNSSHSTSLATAINCNMGASNPPTGTCAALLDTRSSCVHTGNINSNISNGINQHNRSAGVMNAQNGYQVEFGGNPITGLAGAITGQGGEQGSWTGGGGGQNPLGLGGVGQASSDLASEQDPHPTPIWGAQPAFLNQPYPITHGIPKSTKKKAWLGQDVPLYMFLPGFTDQDSSATLVPTQQEDGTFALIARKSEREKSLSQRVLSPTEFTNAFTRFKEVILERFPHRSRELDAYLINIIDLATKYTGKAYWQYHTQFSKQAASLWARGIRVDWSVIDPIILHKAIASERALFCDHCQDALHSTSACPFSPVSLAPLAPKPKSDSTSSKPPWQKIYYKGVEVCGMFNHRETGCNLKTCNYAHVCLFCQSENHGLRTCKKAKNGKKGSME